MPTPRHCPLRLAAALFASTAAVAQAANEFDFDTTQLPVTVITPNGNPHQITTQVTYTGQNLQLNVPVTVKNNGELRLLRSQLRVFGNIVMEEGGRITVIDSDLLMPCAFQRQFEIRTEGGLLHTERARIGSGYLGGSLFLTRILHLRGTWLARNTIIQSTSLILADGRTGWFGNTAQKGGSLFGIGVYEGDRADFIHMSGMGDVQLANGTMNVSFYYEAGGHAGPVAVTVDLDSRNPLTRTYGDPLKHTGVTSPIDNGPYRLSLTNHRSPFWTLHATDADPAQPLQTMTLQNAEDIVCNFRGNNLTGTPILAGPWGSYYATLPGLPSTNKPGYHALPPGCSVQLANVRYQSGPGVNDWNRIRFWGVYVTGAASNLTINGPTNFGELHVNYGVVNLTSSSGFEMGSLANTLRCFYGGTLNINNAAIGDFSLGSPLVGLIECNHNSTCTVTNSRIAAMRFRTTNAAASISGSNLFGVQNIITDTAAGGTVSITQATPAQSWDLQNPGFESALIAGNVPPYWGNSAVTGSLVAGASPGAPAPNASVYQFQGTAAGAYLQKQFTMPVDTYVSFLGSARITAAPTSGVLQFSTWNGAQAPTDALNLGLINSWQRLHVPVVNTTALGTTLRFTHTGTGGLVQLDDMRMLVGNWWEQDNLGNLGFEGLCRDQGLAPNYWVAPDAWYAFQVQCATDAGVTRPGALAGSTSIRMTPTAASGSISKSGTFFRAGESVRVRGWMRGTPTAGANMQAVVGNGAGFAVVAPPNVFSGPQPCDGVWRQFDLTYVVPTSPSYTRIDLGATNLTGVQVWYDDVTVKVQ
ncbi:MAG: hypothetical protein WAT39_12175 [Planctomycetota bacterium]